jgi:N-methylhydantoinase A
MEREARASLLREGFPAGKQRHERLLAARYRGQSFELELSWTGQGNVARSFHAAHRARYGYAQEANPVEIVSARLRSTGLVKSLKTERAARPEAARGKRSTAKPRGHSPVQFAEGERRAALYLREELAAGSRLSAPCIVLEYSSTTLVPPGAKAELDQYGNLIIEP